MKNTKDIKTEIYLNSLILSLTKKKINEPIRNEIEFTLGALFIYLLMIKVNTNKTDNNIYNHKNKLLKKNICIHMAEKIKEFSLVINFFSHVYSADFFIIFMKEYEGFCRRSLPIIV